MMGICARCHRPCLPRAHAAPHQVHELPFPTINDAPALFLPRLKHLELVTVHIPKDDMERLLCGCTALEFLRLQAMNWSSTLQITSRTLCTIYVCCWCCSERSQKVDHNMVIQDTPSLERLLVVDQQGPTRINVISAPKLKVVGYSSVKYFNFQVQQSPYIPLLLDIYQRYF